MYLGRLALATGWSGNLDYMSAQNSLLVNYRLVPVQPGEYPHGEGQYWAEPDIENAVTLLEAVLSDVQRAREIARRGRRSVELEYSYRAVGLRILNRVTEIRMELRRSAEGTRNPKPSSSVASRNKVLNSPRENDLVAG